MVLFVISSIRAIHHVISTYSDTRVATLVSDEASFAQAFLLDTTMLR